MSPSIVRSALSILASLAIALPAMAQEAPPPWAATKTPAPYLPEFVSLDDAEGMDLSGYGYVRANRKIKPLIVTGAVVFGSTYLLTTFAGFVAADAEYDEAGLWSIVPVLGPAAWMASPGGSNGTNYLLGLSTVAQGSGVTLFALGLKGKKGWKRQPQFLFTPSAAPGGGGVTATGSF